MSQTRHKLAAAIQAIVRKLEDIAAALDSDESSLVAEVSPEITAKVTTALAVRKCLQCGRALGPKENYRLGLCPAHYQETRIRVRDGQTTIPALIAAGMMAPKGKTGRRKKRSALDDFIESQGHSRSEASPDTKGESPPAKENSGHTSGQGESLKSKKRGK